MEGILTIAQPTRSESRLGQFKLVDPHDWTDVKEIMSINEAVYDALVGRGPDLRIVPGLAHRWQVSPDGRSWTLFLREGVKFHNGERFDSEAVRFSLERMANPPTGATFAEANVFAQYLHDVQVEVLGDHTIRLRTESPNADLLEILADAYIVPPKATQDMGESFKFGPVGTGAFKFVEWTPGKRVVAEANQSYFGGAPGVKRVTWNLIPDSAARLQELEQGRADIILGVEPEDVDGIETEQGIHVVGMRDSCSYIYFFNCATGPFSHSKARQAVNFAIDKTAIINSVLKGAGYELSGYVGPAHRHLGFDPEVEPYPYDPVKASRLLAEAGYADGLAITIDTPTSLPAEAVELSEIIVEQLEKVGIHADLDVTADRLEYAGKVRHREIGNMCCFDSTPLSTYRVLREKISSRFKGAWWEGYENTQVDTLIDAANREFDERRRRELYYRCFRLIHDDPPWLFLYNTQSIFGVADKLRGWHPRLDGCVIPQWIPAAD
jgi:peptide/nickel transport system substrate-binding protein